jgi:hypothetical protein
MNQKNIFMAIAFVVTAVAGFVAGRMTGSSKTGSPLADMHSRPNHPGVPPGMPPDHLPPHLRERRVVERPKNEKLTIAGISKNMQTLIEEFNNPPEPGTEPSKDIEEINANPDKYVKDFELALEKIPDSHFHIRQQLIVHLSRSNLSAEKKMTILERELERQPVDPSNEHLAISGSITILMEISNLMGMNLEVIKPLVIKALSNPKMGNRQKEELKRFIERLEHRPRPPHHAPAPDAPPPEPERRRK